MIVSFAKDFGTPAESGSPKVSAPDPATTARVTGAVVRAGAGPEPVTEACQLYTCTQGPVWVDTVGWEDRLSDNVDTFQVLALL